jgi:hypothetical protein
VIIFDEQSHLTDQSLAQAPTDPAEANKVKVENPGTVTSDSLAAESINQGGQFAADSSSRGPNGPASHSTTTNTTDASNATELPAASNHPSRPDGKSKADSDAVINEGRVPVKHEVVDPNSQFQKPKGKDLHEGGFDSSAPNASFRTDIGSKRDPGRVALQGLVRTGGFRSSYLSPLTIFPPGGE